MYGLTQKEVLIIDCQTTVMHPNQGQQRDKSAYKATQKSFFVVYGELLNEEPQAESIYIQINPLYL
ncbi:MAG TPA: hypothetical protein PK657_13615 [Legionella sp.]|nr:hypothetical protein [Legionella sp.]